MMFYDVESSEALWIALGILAVVGIVPAVFFLLNLHGLLEQVRPQNRTMQPNLVWLNLIPFFNYAWLIVTVVKIRDSVDAEIRSRGWVSKGDSGFGVGLAFAILWLFAGILFLIPFLVCWIVYWIKTAELKKQLAQPQPGAGWVPMAAPPVHGPASPGGQTQQTTAVSQTPRLTCPTCGLAAEQGDVFCRSCGRDLNVGSLNEPEDHEVADQKGCPFCGALNRPNARFCSSCGRPIS